MSRQVSPATGRPYGLARVPRSGACRAPPSTATAAQQRPTRKRPGPLGAMPDEALVGQSGSSWPTARSTARATARSGPGCASPASAPPRRVLRLMREHGLLAHQRAGRPHGPRAHDGTITTEGSTRCGAPT